MAVMRDFEEYGTNCKKMWKSCTISQMSNDDIQKNMGGLR